MSHFPLRQAGAYSDREIEVTQQMHERIFSKIFCAEDALVRCKDAMQLLRVHPVTIGYANDQLGKASTWLLDARQLLVALLPDDDDQDAIDTPIVTEAPASDVFPEPDQADVKGGA